MSARYCALVFLCLAIAARADDEPPPKKIKAAEARQFLGQKVSVTFVVQASKDAVKRKVVFLDSERDFRDPKNLGIIIPEDVGARLVQKIGNNPATYYKDRTIRVIGKVVEEEERCYIRLAEPEQIEVVEAEQK